MILLFLNLLLFSFNTRVIDFNTKKDTTTINFGILNSGEYVIASQYVEININDNNQWRLDVFTDNDNYAAVVPTTTDKFRNGLVYISSVTRYRAPLLWQIYDDTQNVSALTLSSSTLNQWFYVKDKNDDDWATSYSTSYYTRIAYYDMDGLFIKQYNEDKIANSPFYLYFGADFNGKIPAGVYFTTVTLSLAHLSDVEIPFLNITFAPESKIYDKESELVFKGSAGDLVSGLKEVKLIWKEEGGNYISSSTKSSNFQFEIPSLNKETTIYYYIVCYDNTGNWRTYSVENSSGYFNQNFSTPTFLSILIMDKLTVSVSSGSVKLTDANPDDGETEVVLPDFKKNVEVTIKKISPPTGAAVSYEITASEEPSDKILIKLLYKDLDDNGKEDSLLVDESLLRMYYYDGFDWRYIGGDVDLAKNIVSAYVYHLSKFALFPVTSLSSDDWKPKEKIITPALKDGKNDYAQFSLNGDFKIYIYTISGKLVRKLENVSVWDGEDNNGDIVEAGSYIYKIEKDGKEVFGVITVAK